MSAPYTTAGKQVLHTVDALWAHYADAVTPAAAEHIAEALTTVSKMDGWRPIGIIDWSKWPESRGDEMVVTKASTVQPIKVRGTVTWVHDHHTERQGDEYACSCGVRWDASEGEEHP